MYDKTTKTGNAKTGKTGRDSGGRFKKGHKLSVYSGIYSKRIPLAIRRHSTIIRQAMIMDIAGSERDCSTAQLILIDKAIAVNQITMSIEGFVRENGVFKSRKLHPVLANYTTYVDRLRLILKDLGISKHVGDRVLDPLQIANEIDAEKKKGKEKAKKGIGQ